MQFPDTIFALATGRPPSGVAVIRLSGARSRTALERLFGRVPAPRVATLGAFHTEGGSIIDRGLALFFPGPASFTGEDCAEFHLHGGRAVVEAVSAELLRLDGVRIAEPGEFTRRAFLNGKMDLVGAEALADLVAAETEAQRRFAVVSAGGAQSTLYAGWRQRIVRGRAMIEAELDFADEGDVPGSVAGKVWQDITALADEIDAHIGGFHRAEIIREGYSVVIAGAPNAGKSSLLNALARRDVAIVTDEPGTTRDLVHASLDLDGVKVVITDTAGIREGAGRVESIGIERALESAREADLVIHLIDIGDRRQVALPDGRQVLRVGNKSDLAAVPASGFDLLVSAKTGAGISELLAMLAETAHAAAAIAEGSVIPARLRHVVLLKEASAALRQAAETSAGLELRAEELRRAGEMFGRIAGTVDVDEVLGVIFSEFCIGK